MKNTLSFGRDEYEVSCDLTQAGAPLLIDGNPTPYQAATAKHREYNAMQLAARYIAVRGGGEDDEPSEYRAVRDGCAESTDWYIEKIE